MSGARRTAAAAAQAELGETILELARVQQKLTRLWHVLGGGAPIPPPPPPPPAAPDVAADALRFLERNPEGATARDIGRGVQSFSALAPAERAALLADLVDEGRITVVAAERRGPGPKTPRYRRAERGAGLVKPPETR